MTDALIALIPQYGLYVIGVTVFLACLAMPLPASMLVLAAGGFAATEDLVLWQVAGVILLAFVLGDQVVFGLSRTLGARVLKAARKRPRVDRMMDRSARMLARRGPMAIFLSHTVFSPTGPYVSALSGVGGVGWLTFSMAAITGALFWTMAYVGLGYVFVDQLALLAEITGNLTGVIVALTVIVLCVIWLRRRWRASVKAGAGAAKTEKPAN